MKSVDEVVPPWSLWLCGENDVRCVVVVKAVPLCSLPLTLKHSVKTNDCSPDCEEEFLSLAKEASPKSFLCVLCGSVVRMTFVVSSW